jgi:membrane protease subunit HflK
MRLGKYQTTAAPGLHFKLPFAVDRVYKLVTENVHKEEFGFRTREVGIRSDFDTNYPMESLMLTGDLNIANVEWAVQYKIDNPKEYLFNIREDDPEHTSRVMRDLSESIMRKVIGNRTVDQVLTAGRNEIQGQMAKELQETLDRYKSGLRVITVQLLNVTPPDPVKPSFNDVNKSEQDKERMINEARSEYNKQIPQARGDAERVIATAEGYAINRVNRAKGDAARFLNLYEEYKKAKDVTRKRLYLETMTQILPSVKDLYIVDDKQKGLLPLLDLNRGGNQGGQQ